MFWSGLGIVEWFGGAGGSLHAGMVEVAVSCEPDFYVVCAGEREAVLCFDVLEPEVIYIFW